MQPMNFQILLRIFECFLLLSENDCRKPNCGSDSIYIDADEEWSSTDRTCCTGRLHLRRQEIFILHQFQLRLFPAAAYSGIRELFNKAGIDSFPTTWDEFWACCDKLYKRGYHATGYATDGTGWAPMLLASAAVASSSEEGAEFMSLISSGHLPECFRAGIGKIL